MHIMRLPPGSMSLIIQIRKHLPSNIEIVKLGSAICRTCGMLWIAGARRHQRAHTRARTGAEKGVTIVSAEAVGLAVERYSWVAMQRYSS